MTRIGFLSERMLRGFGVDLVIHALANELAARGHDITVYSSVAEDLGPHRYRLERIPTRASSLFPVYDRSARHWAEYIDDGDHDVLFIESFPFFSLIPRLRTATVAVDHGVSPTTGMSLAKRVNFAYMRLTQERLFFPRAAAVVTVSNFVRSRLPGPIASRSQVIYNGVDHYPAAIPSDRERMRSRLGVRPEETLLLYVGRLSPEGQPYKGTSDLMAAAAAWRGQAPELRMAMVGHGSEADASRIGETGAIPLTDVPSDEMPSVYAAADIYLTASQWEGFDLPILEAASQGVPSVALRVGAHPEIVRHGETGILTSDVQELFHAARQLAEDLPRARTMGEAAQRHASAFTWVKAADAYEALVQELGRAEASSPAPTPRPRRAPPSQSFSGASTEVQPEGDLSSGGKGERPPSDVTAIVLNYGIAYPVLRKCVASLIAQTCPVQLLVVDNHSPRNQDALDALEAEFPAVSILRLDRNYGFAGGMNRGVDAANTEFVLLLNNDVVLAPDAVVEMRRVIDLGEDVVGVAPKILFESSPNVIDAIGNLINPQGLAYNMGIGQLDIGQYDRVERSFGACFAATLLRRKAFRPGLVGPLDERFFMYYEDVDWYFRAVVLGFRFLTAPSAVVYHAHSLTTRELPYSFKYRLTMRNLLWTVVRNFSGRRARRAYLRIALGLVRNAVRGPHRWASLAAVMEATLWSPVYLLARRQVQGRRRREDQELFDFSHGEQPYFDPVTYTPQRRLEVLEAMYRRLSLLTGEERHRRIAETAASLSATRLRFDREFVRDLLRPLVEEEPTCVHEFLESLDL